MTPLDWAGFAFGIGAPLTTILVTAWFNKKDTWKTVVQQLPRVFNAVEEARAKQGKGAIPDPLLYALDLVENMAGFKLSSAQRAQVKAQMTGINHEVNVVMGRAGVAAPTLLAGLPVLAPAVKPP